MTISSAELLGTVPSGLRDPLLTSFNAIIRNFREHRWEPSELNGGKFCEIVYTILRGHIDGTFPPKPKKPSNMLDACKDLEKGSAAIARSVRIQIPRMLVALYEIRNNRGVGHSGADVDPNHMDALAVLGMAKWILAELIRVFHQTDTATAQAAVAALSDRTVPIIWEVGGKLRVLNASLKMRDKMLLVLYSANRPVTEREIVDWVEHSNPSVFRRDVIRPARRAKLVEYDERREPKTIQLSPAGAAHVEEKLPLTVP